VQNNSDKGHRDRDLMVVERTPTHTICAYDN